MPYYRSRRYRRRPRRYVRRWFRRRFRRYINGSTKSTVRIRTTINKTVSVSSGSAVGPGDVNRVNSFGQWRSDQPQNSVTASPLYRNYCDLYEEVKCIGMKVSLAVVSVVGSADLPSLQIYTAFDRRHGATEADYSAQEIVNSSSYNVATALNNNVAKLTRSVYASDLMEKAQWHDCSLTFTQPSVNVNQWVDGAFNTASNNPNFFTPAFFFCLQSPSLTAANAKTVIVSVSVTYYMAFRSPKFGATSQSTRLDDLGARVSFPDEGGDADPMLDDGAAAVAAADSAAAAADAIQDAPPPSILRSRAARNASASSSSSTRAGKQTQKNK